MNLEKSVSVGFI